MTERSWHTSGSAGIIKDPKILGAFASEHSLCWACGNDGRQYGRRLEIHHLIKTGRSDERCNLSRLCAVCHLLAEGHPYGISTGDGPILRWPVLSLGHVLWLKSHFDPDNYNRSRLAILAHRVSLPRIVKPPACFADEYLKNQGVPWP